MALHEECEEVVLERHKVGEGGYNKIMLLIPQGIMGKITDLLNGAELPYCVVNHKGEKCLLVCSFDARRVTSLLDYHGCGGGSRGDLELVTFDEGSSSSMPNPAVGTAVGLGKRGVACWLHTGSVFSVADEDDIRVDRYYDEIGVAKGKRIDISEWRKSQEGEV